MSGRPNYANAAATRRAIVSAEQAGLRIGGVRLLPDGTIEIIASPRDEKPEPANDYDRLERAGLL